MSTKFEFMPTDITPSPQVVGELFSRLYIERDVSMQDSILFRNRLNAFLKANHFKDYSGLASFLSQESGVIVPSSYLETMKTVYYNFNEFFTKSEVFQLLNSVTLIWRYLRNTYPEKTLSNLSNVNPATKFPKAEAWHAFVLRTLREENMAYTIDKMCGVHFVIDEEFERNRVSALKCLENSRYKGVRTAFETAHDYLDKQPPDFKACVRSAFEALEILARLIDPESKNLNKWMVENKLKPIAISFATDAIESEVVGRLFDGLALIVDSLHHYRHGQGVEQPIAPSPAVAVYVVSQVSAALRWLVTLDDEQIKKT